MSRDPTPALWRKSTYSNSQAACVEVADLAAGGQAVRDSKLGDASPVLWFGTAELSALAAAVRDGQIG
jgi:uncharacterized protein DUF397